MWCAVRTLQGQTWPSFRSEGKEIFSLWTIQLVRTGSILIFANVLDVGSFSYLRVDAVLADSFEVRAIGDLGGKVAGFDRQPPWGP